MKQLTIFAMDANGDVVSEYTTEKEWCLSELDHQYDILKVALYNDEIDHILIGRSEE